MPIDRYIRQTRETVAVLVAELTRAEQSGGSTSSFDEVLLRLDLQQPPPQLKAVAEALRLLEDGVLDAGGWSAKTYPLGAQHLRELILGQLLGFLSRKLEVLRDIYLERAGIDLETLEMLLPSA